jgi:hypothetical protein
MHENRETSEMPAARECCRTAGEGYGQTTRMHISEDLAAQTAGSPHGPWRIAHSPALHLALPNVYLAGLGLPPMVVTF